jgi:hypothetical protein
MIKNDPQFILFKRKDADLSSQFRMLYLQKFQSSLCINNHALLVVISIINVFNYIPELDSSGLGDNCR